MATAHCSYPDLKDVQFVKEKGSSKSKASAKAQGENVAVIVKDKPCSWDWDKKKGEVPWSEAGPHASVSNVKMQTYLKRDSLN